MTSFKNGIAEAHFYTATDLLVIGVPLLAVALILIVILRSVR